MAKMIEQGTDEWLQERLGYATASRFKDVVSGKTAESYMNKLIAERLTGVTMPGAFGKDIDRGIEQEPYAKMAYTAQTGNIIEDKGFIKHNDSSLLTGCSPDGLLGDDGGVEIKCVIPSTQVQTILKKGYPKQHMAQIQGCMWVTGRKYWDFISYCPDLPENLQLYIFRVERNEADILHIERDVRYFLSVVQKKFDELNGVKL